MEMVANKRLEQMEVNSKKYRVLRLDGPMHSLSVSFLFECPDLVSQVKVNSVKFK